MTASFPISILLGATITLCATRLLLRNRVRGLLAERPADCHHTHRTPVVRLGGLGFVLSFLAIELFIPVFYPEQRRQTPCRDVFVISSVAMFMLGFWDDLRPLGAKRKLLVQILIALAACFGGIVIEWLTLPFGGGTFHLGIWRAIPTVFWLVGITNLINFIDGLDGLAGGISLMLMVLAAVIGHYTGAFELVTAGMVGALAAFLWFNLPPARIYMGDGGAYFLGFQIAALAILNSQHGAIPVFLVAPLFVLAWAILDMALTILRRGLRGLPVFRPDKKHLHHRLLDMGVSHSKALIFIYALTLPFLLLSGLAVWSGGHLAPLFGVAALILLIYARALPFSRRWFAVGTVLGNSLGMRRQTRFALSFGRWFELEGGRHENLESLWDDFVLAARKLGFCSVKVSLADSERVWERKLERGRPLSARFEMQSGRFGIVEFKVPGCPRLNGHALSCEGNPACELHSKGCPSDPRVFEVLSELLAESWTKAANTWSQRHFEPLRFKHTGDKAGSLNGKPPTKKH